MTVNDGAMMVRVRERFVRAGYVDGDGRVMMMVTGCAIGWCQSGITVQSGLMMCAMMFAGRAMGLVLWVGSASATAG